jgi:hypothetical protein
MSRKLSGYIHLLGSTIEETTANILSANNREVKSTGKKATWRYDDQNILRQRAGTKYGVGEQEFTTELGNKYYRMVPMILTGSRPMNPAKAQRIAATLHRNASGRK